MGDCDWSAESSETMESEERGERRKRKHNTGRKTEVGFALIAIGGGGGGDGRLLVWCELWYFSINDYIYRYYYGEGEWGLSWSVGVSTNRGSCIKPRLLVKFQPHK